MRAFSTLKTSALKLDVRIDRLDAARLIEYLIADGAAATKCAGIEERAAVDLSAGAQVDLAVVIDALDSRGHAAVDVQPAQVLDDEPLVDRELAGRLQPQFSDAAVFGTEIRARSVVAEAGPVITAPYSGRIIVGTNAAGLQAERPVARPCPTRRLCWPCSRTTARRRSYRRGRRRKLLESNIPIAQRFRAAST